MFVVFALAMTIKLNRKEKTVNTLLFNLFINKTVIIFTIVFDCQYDQITKKKKKKERSCNEK